MLPQDPSSVILYNIYHQILQRIFLSLSFKNTIKILMSPLGDMTLPLSSVWWADGGLVQPFTVDETEDASSLLNAVLWCHKEKLCKQISLTSN